MFEKSHPNNQVPEPLREELKKEESMSNSNSMTLEELAAQISDCSKALATFYAQSGYPRPDNTASEKLLPNDAPDLVQQARHTLLEAAEEIKQRYSEPSEYLEQHQVNVSPLPPNPGEKSKRRER